MGKNCQKRFQQGDYAHVEINLRVLESSPNQDFPLIRPTSYYAPRLLNYEPQAVNNSAKSIEAENDKVYTKECVICFEKQPFENFYNLARCPEHQYCINCIN